MNKEAHKLTIVIINYKTPSLCIDCLKTLIPEIETISAKVILVDNASGEKSVRQIQAWVDKQGYGEIVSVISSLHNSGFSGGNNVGIQKNHSEFYLLLNSDTLIRENAIKILLSAAEEDHSAGLISPRLEWPDGTPQESCFKFQTPVSELINAASTGFISHIFQRYIVAQPICAAPANYDWTSFACVLIRSSVFEDIGLMDDGYFMYFEDVAFAYQAKRAGWKVLNVPNARVVHLRGGSSPLKSQAKQRKRLPRYYYESRTRFFYQIYGRFGLLIANMFWTLGYGVSWLRSLLPSSFVPNVSAYQWRDIWINFLQPLKEYIHPDDYS